MGHWGHDMFCYLNRVKPRIIPRDDRWEVGGSNWYNKGYQIESETYKDYFLSPAQKELQVNTARLLSNSFSLVTNKNNSKMKFIFAACLVGLASHVSSTPIFDGSRHLSFKDLDGVTSDSLHNIHVEYLNEEFDGPLHMVYGDCSVAAVHQSHSFVGRTLVKSHAKPKRFVWIVPAAAVSGGCLHAFSGSEIVGRSNPINIGAPLKKRQVIADVADPSGPWFDGVAYMKSKNNSASFVASAKDQSKF